ncbi:MAG: hypothetical protein ABI357_09310, partial [Granulicella sp.]
MSAAKDQLELRSHGMNGSLVAPDWPALTLEELQPILRRYSLPEEGIQILSKSPRPFSAAS